MFIYGHSVLKKISCNTAVRFKSNTVCTCRSGFQRRNSKYVGLPSTDQKLFRYFFVTLLIIQSLQLYSTPQPWSHQELYGQISSKNQSSSLIFQEHLTKLFPNKSTLNANVSLQSPIIYFLLMPLCPLYTLFSCVYPLYTLYTCVYTRAHCTLACAHFSCIYNVQLFLDLSCHYLFPFCLSLSSFLFVSLYI